MIAWTIGSADAAVELLRPAIAEDPYAPVGTFWLGFALSETGRTQEAEELLADYERRAAESESPLPRFWRPLLAGVLMQARGDLAGARRELAAADAQPVEYRDRGLAAPARAPRDRRG
jgi:predicted Zn-dependent protease